MKKKYLIAVLLLVVGSFSAQAQFIQFGVKGGVNFPSLSSTSNVLSFDTKTGWHAGAMVQLKIPIVKVGAEFLYSTNTTNIASQNFNGDLQASYFEIPVFAKLTLLKIINIHTGPQFSFITSAKLDGTDIKDDWENNSFRWMAGLGLTLGPLDVHGRFIFPSTTTWQSAGEDIKNSNIQISAGYWFGGRD